MAEEDLLQATLRVIIAGSRNITDASVVSRAIEQSACRREGGRPVAAATVITAEKDGQKRHFLVTENGLVEYESYQAAFGPMLTEPDPERPIAWKGRTGFLHRYALHWAGYEPGYEPRTPKALSAARQKREEKAVAREAEGSLFSEIVKAEGYVPPRRKGRGR